jgi:hypothetical protein
MHFAPFSLSLSICLSFFIIYTLGWSRLSSQSLEWRERVRQLASRRRHNYRASVLRAGTHTVCKCASVCTRLTVQGSRFFQKSVGAEAATDTAQAPCALARIQMLQVRERVHAPYSSRLTFFQKSVGAEAATATAQASCALAGIQCAIARVCPRALFSEIR